MKHLKTAPKHLKKWCKPMVQVRHGDGLAGPARGILRVAQDLEGQVLWHLLL